MTPAARVQAAIEIVDAVIASARDDGPPADAIVSAYFKTRRYAGSKDRRAVRNLVFRAIRRTAEPPRSGRIALLGLEDAAALFEGSAHGPALQEASEKALPASFIPDWIQPLLSPLVDENEWPSLLERAPIDLRANIARTTRDAMLEAIEDSQATDLSPWGLRLSTDRRIDDHPAFLDGLVEVQDEGSQLIALAGRPDCDMVILDLCAGAGGKALALSAAAPRARIIASDTNRQRLSRLEPRAQKAGAAVETMLLDGGREADQLSVLEGQCDLVLVDAPCSGSGTWRRNPEGRWRLTPDRLNRVADLQAHVLDLAAPLMKPGGALVYAVCSLVSREGAQQVDAFLGRHSSWSVQDAFDDFGRRDGHGRLLTPAHDRTDGFFVARLERA
ncbi:MAG: RsmB/NOP family class I SAM-dependent RNA methyltransferase [Sphingomicrobium sp.]